MHEQTPAPLRRRRDWNAVSALIAAGIGLVALLVSGYTAVLQRQQVRAEVWPYLETGISPNQRQVTLTNKGVGPAQVRALEVYVDGEPQRTWPDVFDALGLPELRDTPRSTVNGVVISAGGVVQQLNFATDEGFRRFYAQYPRIALRACYCSALGECWVLDERDRDTANLRTEVGACRFDDAHAFIDNIIVDPAALPRSTDTEEQP